MSREAVARAFETLLVDGDEACLAWLRAAGAGGTVELVEGPLESPEALALVHGLVELGRTAEALDVMRAVCATRHRGQGRQQSAGWAQGRQVADA